MTARRSKAAPPPEAPRPSVTKVLSIVALARERSFALSAAQDLQEDIDRAAKPKRASTADRVLALQLLRQRGEALRDLVSTIAAVTLTDAAVQLGLALSIAMELEVASVAADNPAARRAAGQIRCMLASALEATLYHVPKETARIIGEDERGDFVRVFGAVPAHLSGFAP